MAEGYEEWLKTMQAPNQGPVSVPAGSGTDEYDQWLRSQSAPAQSAAEPAAAQPDQSYEKWLASGGQEEPSFVSELGRLAYGGMKRNVAQWHAAPYSLLAMKSEAEGDQATAVERAKTAKGILDTAGDSEWNLQNLRSPGDFLKYTAETLGEQSVTALAMLLTGGVGAKGGAMAADGVNVLSQKLLERAVITESSRRALMLAGGGAFSAPLNVGLETAGTSQEQFDLTGSTQPERSLTAGTIKGALESVVPFTITKALLRPGLQLGSTLPRAVGKVAGLEAATEVAQEAVDIYYAKVAKPDYSYFKEGPTLMPSGWGEGMWRLAESAVKGGIAGGVYGAPAALAERSQERRATLGTQPKGDMQVVQQETKPELAQESRLRLFPGLNQIPKQNKAEPGDDQVARDLAKNDNSDPEIRRQLRDLDAQERRAEFRVIENSGPVTQLRNAVLKDTSIDELPQESRSPVLLTLPKADRRQQALEALDASVPRYLEMQADGQWGTRAWTDTELELEQAINRPQGVKPRLLRIDPSSLQPAGMSATIWDLGEPGERVWFLKGVTPEQQQKLAADYAEMWTELKTVQGKGLLDTVTRAQIEADFSPRYAELLRAGLRVIPSHGSGFHYSAGTVEGTEVELAQTKRSQEVAWYDMVTGVMTPMNLEGSATFVDTPDQNVLVSVDRNKLKDGDVTFLEGKTFRVNKRLAPGKFTPGLQLLEERDLNLEATSFPSAKTTVMMADVKNREYAVKMKAEVDKFAPLIDKVLRAVGLDKGVNIYISDSVPVPGAEVSKGIMFTQYGAMQLRPEAFEANALVDTGSFEANLLNTIMHELGHQISFHFYKHLPVEVKEKLWYAWGKARLSFEMGDSSKIESAGAKAEANMDYWTSFVEWLAEQFRRWSTSNEEVKGWIEAEYKAGARKLEVFYREWEKQFGAVSKANLSEPDYFFSGFMDYLRGFGSERERFKQLIKQQALYQVDATLLDSPLKLQLVKQFDMALKSLKGVVPPEVELRLNSVLDPKLVPGFQPTKEQAEMNMGRWIPDLNIMEIAVGALPAQRTFEVSRQLISHESMHAYESLGIITPQEIGVLMRDVKGHEHELFPPNEQQLLRNRVKEYGEANGWTSVQIQAKFEEMRDRELRAYYIQRFADTSFAYSEQGRGILSWLLTVFERVRNFFQGLGYQTKEDVIQAFFKGEMVARRELKAQKAEAAAGAAMAQYAASAGDAYWNPERSWTSGEFTVSAVGDKGSANVVYQWKDRAGVVAGVLELSNHGPKGFNIEWVENKSDRFALGLQMIQEAEKDLGMKAKLAGEFTEEGFKQATVFARMRGQKSALELYQSVKVGDKLFWLSPNALKQKVAFWTWAAKAAEKGPIPVLGGTVTQQQAIQQITVYRTLLSKLPADIWSDPRLEQMFSLRRNYMRDEVQGALIRDGQQQVESKLMAAAGMGQELPDVWRQSFDQSSRFSQAENARRTGTPFELSAPNSSLTYEMRKSWERFTGYGASPAAERETINTLHELDRIGKFSKYLWSLDQLILANEKAWNIGGLLDLGQHKEQMLTMQNAWVRRADQTAREWRQQLTTPERKEGVTSSLFALTEQEYLTPAERAAGVKRMPTGWDQFIAGAAPTGETLALFQKNKLNAKDLNIIRTVHKDFSDFLTNVEQVSLAMLNRKFANAPQALQNAVAELQKDLVDFRSKPYFPMLRFGEFTISVRESGKVVWASAYARQSQRDSAIADVRRKYPSAEIKIGRVPGSASEFMALPSPLLKLVKENLFDKAGKTAEQVKLIEEQQAWIEEFELLHSPDRTFRKRWMPQSGLPGYSQDAFRAYSHYFQYGSRYLSRLAFMDLMQDDIARLEASKETLGNTAKRQAIINYAKDWLAYILEPGRDSGKFRAIVAHWYLGFSPAAAFMNLTQTLTTTIPWLSGQFGAKEGYGALNWGLKASLAARDKPTGSPAFQRAREEMVRQGYIDVGQAPELASFAEGQNLKMLQSTTKAQEALTKLGFWSMAMFGMTERFNRELAMRAAWELAIKNPQAKRLREIDVLYPIEVSELSDPKGLALSHEEAIAFLFAKETIKRTQFVYDKTSDPPFMRGPQKDLFIFLKYTQSMLYAFGHNQSTIHMLLVFAFLYGLSGIPGSEDGNELIKWIANRFFGKDIDLLKEARKLVATFTQGTAFEDQGPDLAMHGVSRFGFGLGLLPDHWGIPRFDASASGSMGKVIPGFAELMNGMATGKAFPDVFAESAQRVAGAGYGTFYTMMQVGLEGPSADGHKWEQLLQRQLKAVAKAYRYGPEDLPALPKLAFGYPSLEMTKAQGGETTRGGAKIVRFDASDPDDIATVLAQALGFTPTKVSQRWEAIREMREEVRIMDMRRKALIVQFDKAVLEKNAKAIEDVTKAIDRFNLEVSEAAPEFAIGRGLQQSLRQRSRARTMQEETLGTNKREMMVMERLKGLYPGAKIEQVK